MEGGAPEPVQFPTHTVTLRGPRLTLRPLIEGDWPQLLVWNNDPLVLATAEGDAVDGYTLAELQATYRHVVRTAFCFIIERDGEAIGDCWLQQLNLPQRCVSCASRSSDAVARGPTGKGDHASCELLVSYVERHRALTAGCVAVT